MPPELCREYFSDIARNILLGRLQILLLHMRIPFVVYAFDTTFILNEAEQANRALRQYRAMLKARRARFVDVESSDRLKGTTGLEKYRVVERYHDGAGHIIGRVELRYFVRRIEGKPVIEMIEHVENSVFDNPRRVPVALAS